MELQIILPWAFFGAITAGIWAAMSFFAGAKSRASERLDELRDPTLRNRDGADGEKQNGMGAMLGKAAPTLSKVVQPKTELEVSELKVRLANAGLNSPNAPQIYLALKVALLLGGMVLAGGFGLAKWGMTQNGITALIIGGGFGFYCPEIGLWFLRRGRQEKIFLQLPDALDLLVVCVEAGLGLDAGMRRVRWADHDARYFTTWASAPVSTTCEPWPRFLFRPISSALRSPKRSAFNPTTCASNDARWPKKRLNRRR